jgi:hypothetical protein
MDSAKAIAMTVSKAQFGISGGPNRPTPHRIQTRKKNTSHRVLAVLIFLASGKGTVKALRSISMKPSRVQRYRVRLFPAPAACEGTATTGGASVSEGASPPAPFTRLGGPEPEHGETRANARCHRWSERWRSYRRGGASEETTSHKELYASPSGSGSSVCYLFSSAMLTQERPTPAKAPLRAASASAEASRVAAEAQSSGQAAQNKAARLVVEQEACAALGGTVRESAWYSDLCVSNQGESSDGTSCGFASIPFQSDGTLLSKDISDFKGGYPGCFR